MGDRKSNRAKLRDKFELEKFHPKAVKSASEMESSPSNFDQKQKAKEMEEIVKYMKHLPRYLERGKLFQDQALTFGVMDLARLEKWQNRHYKQGLLKSNKCSPSSSYSTLFSGDGSSPRSSRDKSCSPARQKPHRVTLQSHFKASPIDDCNSHFESAESVENFQYLKEPPKQSCSKGKLKIQDESVDDNTNPSTSTIQCDAINVKNSQKELDFSRNQRKSSSFSSKNCDKKSRSVSPLRRFSFSIISATERPNSPVSQSSIKDSNRSHSSPLRRLLDPIFPSKEASHEDSRTRAKLKLDFDKEFTNIKSSSKGPNSPVSQSSIKDSNRSHSSPLRRLLDPMFPSKETTSHEDSRTRAKMKLDFNKEITQSNVDDGSSSSWKQALFQTTVKNERLLFTFAVESNTEILAATVTGLTSSVKDNNRNLLFTLFTVNEVKKKNISWLSQGNKSKDHGYVPNVTAQMKVSNSQCDTREFVLFSVNPNIQPQEELEAVVVKFSRMPNGGDNQESFSTTVILPGGSHGVPNKGEPSPLVDRWRSGGVCDCGGWDMGCRLRTLSNQVQSSGSISDKTHMTASQFELYCQGELQNKRPFFSLSPLKEGIYSINYNASLSPLQAFSICISYLESKNMTQHMQLRAHIPQQVTRMYTPIPRIKRSVTGKVTSV